MPRKYRPPATRRRKSKRPPPYFVEPAPHDGDVAASVPDETATITSVEAEAAPAATHAPARAAERDKPVATKHISRDYSYVRDEVKRIALVVGFLIASLMIVALLRI